MQSHIAFVKLTWNWLRGTITTTITILLSVSIRCFGVAYAAHEANLTCGTVAVAFLQHRSPCATRGTLVVNTDLTRTVCGELFQSLQAHIRVQSVERHWERSNKHSRLLHTPYILIDCQKPTSGKSIPWTKKPMEESHTAEGRNVSGISGVEGRTWRPAVHPGVPHVLGSRELAPGAKPVRRSKAALLRQLS
eukprot:366080-Amphidinium_carterae.1